MRLLDLYCGAGGAAKGYADAGFTEIVGVDVEEQRHYPYEFIQSDALGLSLSWMREFDAIHASPPCQGYSTMTLNLPWFKGKTYPLLILPTMRLLDQVGRPYVVENVMGARKGSVSLKKREIEEHGLEAGWLCGMMFGLPFYRHRLFAANWLWLALAHPKHTLAGHPRSKRFAYGGDKKGLQSGAAGLDIRSETFRDAKGRERPRESAVASPLSVPRHPNPVNSRWRETHDGTGLNRKTPRGHNPDGSEDQRGDQAWPGRREQPAGLNIREGYETHALNYPTVAGGLPTSSTGVGHAAGWKLAAEIMGIDWMNRNELTQAIPPVYTEHIGRQLIRLLEIRR